MQPEKELRVIYRTVHDISEYKRRPDIYNEKISKEIKTKDLIAIGDVLIESYNHTKPSKFSSNKDDERICISLSRFDDSTTTYKYYTSSRVLIAQCKEIGENDFPVRARLQEFITSKNTTYLKFV